MNSFQVKDNLFKRILPLYGLYTLLSNAFFLVGFYLLPDVVLRSSPQMGPAEYVALQTGFWVQFGSCIWGSQKHRCVTEKVVSKNVG